jgi:hypothetical protein
MFIKKLIDDDGRVVLTFTVRYDGSIDLLCDVRQSQKAPIRCSFSNEHQEIHWLRDFVESLGSGEHVQSF